jgi:enoyl-CoA hydratase/carnithine racemase
VSEAESVALTDLDAPATLERRGSVAVLTLNRPHVLNAVNVAMTIAAGAAVEAAHNDPEIRALVITGAGRAFCVGADLKELAAGRGNLDPDHPERGFAGIVKQWIAKPTIAAVNGVAMGGGAEIVLACDLAVIDETASVGFPEARVGVVASAGGLIRLQRQIPRKFALEALLIGDPISAQRMYELGLANRVVPQGKALDVALSLADRLAANAPLSIACTKQLVYDTYAMGSDWSPEVWRHNDDTADAVLNSEDAREGPRAFAAKRAPVWQGR